MGRKRKAPAAPFNAPSVGEWEDIPADDGGEWVDLPADDWDAPPEMMTPRTAPGIRGNAVQPMRAPVSPGEAVARGGAQGLTLGHGEEMAAWAASLAEDVSPIPGVTGRNGETGADRMRKLRDHLRSQNAEAQAEHPLAYGAGRIGGAAITGAPLAVLTGGGGTGLMAAGAIEGAIAGPGYSENEDASDLAWDAVGGAELGAVSAGLGPAMRSAGRGISTRLRRVADSAEDVAFQQQSNAIGPPSRAVTDAPGGLSRQGRRLDELGGYGRKIQGPQANLRDITALAERTGQAVGAAADELDAAGASVPRKSLADAIRAVGRRDFQTEASRAVRARLDNMAESIEGARPRDVTTRVGFSSGEQSAEAGFDALGTPIQPGRSQSGAAQTRQVVRSEGDLTGGLMGSAPPPTLTFRQAWQLRKELDAVTDFGSDEQNAIMKQKIRAAVDEAMQQAAENANPRSASRWADANANHSTAMEALGGVQQMSARNGRNQLFGMRDIQLGSGALAGGLGLDLATGAGGASASGGGAAFGTGLLTMAGSRALRGKEHALGAAAARGTASGLRSFARFLRASGDSAQRAAPFITSTALTSSGLRETFSPQPPSVRIRERFQSNPQAFGQYAPQIQEALQSGDDVDLGALHFRLMATDPQYRAMYERSEQ